jgi:hypothetical protein
VGCARARAPADKPRADDTRHGRMDDDATPLCRNSDGHLTARSTIAQHDTKRERRARYIAIWPPACRMYVSQTRLLGVRARAARWPRWSLRWRQRHGHGPSGTSSSPPRSSAAAAHQGTCTRIRFVWLRRCACGSSDQDGSSRAHLLICVQQSGLQRQPAAIAHERSTSGRLGGQERQHKWRRTAARRLSHHQRRQSACPSSRAGCAPGRARTATRETRTARHAAFATPPSSACPARRRTSAAHAAG